MVFCSHLHLDHIGWFTRKVKGIWQPTFPDKPHLMTQAELDFWSAHQGDFPWMGESFVDSVQPIVDAGLVQPVVPDQKLAPGVKVIDLPGHSPGMAGLEINRGDQTVVLAADVAHHPLQFREPQLGTIFDADAETSEVTRRIFIDRYADTGAVIVPIHFPKSAGHLKRMGDGARFVPF